MIDEGDSQVESATSFHSAGSSLDLKWGWIEIFIIIQFLSPGILMLPGAQVIRLPVRVLPYFFSVVLFFVLFRQREQKNACLCPSLQIVWRGFYGFAFGAMR
jgi:hypothetical protein